jgi:hypothetical protein
MYGQGTRHSPHCWFTNASTLYFAAKSKDMSQLQRREMIEKVHLNKGHPATALMLGASLRQQFAQIPGQPCGT